MGEAITSQRGYRSLFWPIVLIAVGVIWLLVNVGVLSGANLVVLFRMWPLLLIVIGLDLLFGRQSPLVGAVIGIGAVALIVVLMLVGPSIGLAGATPEVTLDTFSEPLEDASSVQVTLDLPVAASTITALTDSADLFTAEIAHVGELDYRVQGEAEKVIFLGQQDTSVNFFDLEFLSFLPGITEEELYWNIGLNPEVPLELTVNSGVGQNTLDLREMELRALSLNGGVGQNIIHLPAAEAPYTARIDSGSGELNISLAEGANAEISISGGVGNAVIDVPDGAGVRLDASSGIGNIEVPDSYRRVSGDNDDDDGLWESANFAEASDRIVIEFDGGIGNLVVQ